MVAGANWGLGKHPNTATHLRAVEDGRELLPTGIVSNLQLWRPLARQLQWTVGVGRTSEGEGGQRRRESEIQTDRRRRKWRRKRRGTGQRYLLHGLSES